MKDKNFYIGLLICVSVAILGKITSQYGPALGSVTYCLIIGVIVSNILHNKVASFSTAFKFSEKKILPFAIALLGLNINYATLRTIGLQGGAAVVTTIAASILFSLLIAKFLKADRELALLIGIGNGICGSSAIAASSEVLKADRVKTAVSISVINLLGVLGLVLYPIVSKLVGINENSAGIMCGATLQAVGQATAAGFAIGTEAGKAAVLVKMARVLMLGPVLLLLSIKSSSGKFSLRKSVPLFIVVFFLLSLISNIFEINPAILKTVKHIQKYSLLIAMSAVGLNIKLKDIYSVGVRGLMNGTLSWILQIGVVGLVLMIFNIS